MEKIIIREKNPNSYKHSELLVPCLQYKIETVKKELLEK